jgi:hypothetical protein
MASRDPNRVAAKRYAANRNYFWLPCPRCGEFFGGHEPHGPSVQCSLHPDSGHIACCPKTDENEKCGCT